MKFVIKKGAISILKKYNTSRYLNKKSGVKIIIEKIIKYFLTLEKK